MVVSLHGVEHIIMKLSAISFLKYSKYHFVNTMAKKELKSFGFIK